MIQLVLHVLVTILVIAVLRLFGLDVLGFIDIAAVHVEGWMRALGAMFGRWLA